MKRTPAQLTTQDAWHTYSVVDGLPGVFCEHIAEDRQGYLWIATATNGACRFDGDSFVSFGKAEGLSGDEVYSILRDHQDRLWFATLDGGLCYCAPSASDQDFHRPQATAHAETTFLYQDSHMRVWWAGYNSIGYCLEDRFVDLSDGLEKLGNCRGIAEDNQGQIWFALDNLLVRWDGTHFHPLKPENLSGDYGHYCLGGDQSGQVWVGGSRTGLCRLEDQRLVPVELDQQITPLRKIQCDPQGRLWLSTTGRGAFCLAEDQLTHFGPGLAHNFVNAVHCSANGLLFFATYGGGLSCYDAQGLRTLTFAEDFVADSLLFDGEDRLWMSSVLFVPHYELQPPIAFYHNDQVSWPEVPATSQVARRLSMTGPDDAGQILLRARPQPLYYHNGQLQPYASDPGNSAYITTAATTAADGSLVLGLTHQTQLEIPGLRELNKLNATEKAIGLVRHQGGQYQLLWEGQAQSQAEDFPYSQRIIKVVPTAAGPIWFLLFNPSHLIGGGMRSVPCLGCWQPDKTVTWYSTAEGLPHNGVTDILLDRDEQVWIATLGGLCRFDGQRFHTLTRQQGLPGDQVYSLGCDRKGQLWIGTDTGAALYKGTNSTSGYILQSLDSLGLGAVTSIAADPQEGVWFATPQGLKHYRPSKQTPRLRLVQTVADRVYAGDQAVHCSTAVHQVLFEFKGMSFRTPTRDMLYSWRLKGHDTQWSTPTREQRAFYRGLPPGDYHFEVKAIDRDLNQSEVVAVALEVVPDQRDQRIDALERRVQERTAELEEKNRQLEAANAQVREANRLKTEFLARMSHDFRTPMNAIIGYARILLRKLKGQVELRQYQNLENIQTSSHTLLALINDVLDLSKVEAGRVEIHPESFELGPLVNQCLTTIGPLVKAKVTLKQDLDGIGQVHTDPERLGRALLNLLGNAAKFTEAGTITVRARRGNGQLTIAVVDTGAGIDPADLPHIFDEFRQVARKGQSAQEGTGLGLAIVRRSIELLGGSVAVDSSVGQGTTFTLTLPDTAEGARP